MTFVIKSFAPIVAGGGLGTGGVYVYRSVIPTTWQEYLEREGFQILDTSSDNQDFKAIFAESESLIKDSSSDDNLKGASDIDKYSKIKDYCSNELPKKDPKDATTREKLIKLCTYSGISTVKAKITEAKKTDTSKKWINGNEGDDKYKAVFAIYKHSPSFLTWLNEGKTSSQITSSDKPSQKYTDLKNKCEAESKKKHEDNKGNKDVYNKVYWWCMELPYTTVKDRIQKLDSTWQEESTGSTIKNTWQHTQSIKTVIQTDKSKGANDPDESDYQSWCTEWLAKNLHEDGIYQQKYLQIKYVCQKRPSADS